MDILSCSRASGPWTGAVEAVGMRGCKAGFSGQFLLRDGLGSMRRNG